MHSELRDLTARAQQASRRGDQAALQRLRDRLLIVRELSVQLTYELWLLKQARSVIEGSVEGVGMGAMDCVFVF